ncbi:hypothetical protein GCM10017786_43400 [Amycolatopsis deserti]|uniref:Uncharacterized protein n=1 Tax=Amycolatopsis deserti TaxID=185696 RepID=A0ABQ3J6T7_9PSEU|nr:hypothetical protein GCM10017786_43400 [Amycolatopsis deserti]
MLGELGQQTRLAHPGITRYEDRARLTPLGGGEGGTQPSQLVGAGDQWDSGT